MKETSKNVPEDAVALRRGIGGAWMVLVMGTLALFAPVGEFAFVNYDDNVFVYENPHVLAGFTADSVRWAFTSADIDYWRPLCWLSHMLDVELFGLSAGGHHLMSVLIHALAAGIFFSFLRQMTGRLGGSFMVAALFAWHPLHVESVAWIAERQSKPAVLRLRSVSGGVARRQPILAMAADRGSSIEAGHPRTPA